MNRPLDDIPDLYIAGALNWLRALRKGPVPLNPRHPSARCAYYIQHHGYGCITHFERGGFIVTAKFGKGAVRR